MLLSQQTTLKNKKHQINYSQITTPKNYLSKTKPNFKYTKNRKIYDYTSLSFFKQKVTSNASRQSFRINNTPSLFNILKFKTFYSSFTSKKGRSKKGILCRTKGRFFKKTYPLIKKSIRTHSLTFTSGFTLNPLNLKCYSLITLASGEVQYIPSTYKHSLFQITKTPNFLRILPDKLSNMYKYSYLSSYINIQQLFFVLLNSPKLKPISMIEAYPLKGSQYVHSPGSKSYLSKIDYKSNLALLKLPSGVHKTFSTFSAVSLGSIPFSFKKIKTQTKAGFFIKKGSKPLSRGVAKNPVDHPHGGRNKAIKYQRTPWGKTTKYK